MALQTIDTTTGAGDTGKAGGDKINGNIRQIGVRARQFSTVYAFFDGDSKGTEIREGLDWMRSFEGLDLRLDGGAVNVGGTNSGTGTAAGGANLLNPTRIASTAALLTAHSNAGRVVDYFMTIGTNDLSASTPPTTVMANVRKYHEQYVRAQGCVRYFVLCGVDPRGFGAPDGTSVSNIHSLNRLYEAYAAANPFDVIFLDPFPVLLDPSVSNVNGYPVPYTFTNAGGGAPAGSVTDDGLHCSNFGRFTKRLMAAPLKDIYRKRPARSLARGLAGSANARNTNYLTDGRMVALGGTSSITLGGTAAVTGTPPAGWTLTGNLDGSASIAFSTSTVTVTTDGGLIPRGVWPCVKMTFSGTTGSGSAGANNAGVNPALQCTLFPGVLIGEIWPASALLNLNAIVGLMGLRTTDNANAALSRPQLGLSHVAGNGSPLAQAIPTPISGPLLMQADGVPATADQNGVFFNLNFDFAPNTAVSGSIDILNVFVERAGPIPAATP